MGDASLLIMHLIFQTLLFLPSATGSPTAEQSPQTSTLEIDVKSLGKEIMDREELAILSVLQLSWTNP